MKRKIIILSQTFLPEAVGGASRIYEMARLLQRQSYDVEIICPPPTYPFGKHKKAKYIFRKEDFDTIRVFRMWTYQPSKQTRSFFQRVMYYTIFSILSSFFLISQLSRNVSFVIVSVPPSSLLISTFIIRFFKKKLVIDIRDLWVDAAASLSYIKKDSLSAKIVKRFEQYCWRKSDLLLTNSMIIYDILKPYLDQDKNKIVYFPFNVNLNTFKRSEGKRENQVVYIGNLGAAQNLQALIKAMPLVLEVISNLKVHFYGGGDFELDMKKMVKDLGLEQSIIFHDPISRESLPKILSRSLIGIIALADNTALRYAIPTKTFEYFACALPVVAYGSSDELERVIKQSRGGVYVRGSDKQEIANAIISLVNDRTKLEDSAILARTFVEKNTNDRSFLSGIV